MGLLEDYFVPLHNFYLTPDGFDQKVRARLHRGRGFSSVTAWRAASAGRDPLGDGKALGRARRSRVRGWPRHRVRGWPRRRRLPGTVCGVAPPPPSPSPTLVQLVPMVFPIKQ